MVDNKYGLKFKVVKSETVPMGTTGRTKLNHHTVCTACGYKFKPTKIGALKVRKACPGCEAPPSALKKDENGACISICRIGQLEEIHRLISDEGLSQREACQLFIDKIQAHSETGDPLTADITVGQIRSQFLRDSGKLTNKPQPEVVHCEPIVETPVTKRFPALTKLFAAILNGLEPADYGMVLNSIQVIIPVIKADQPTLDDIRKLSDKAKDEVERHGK